MSTAEIAELTRRLRALSAAGRDADADERAAFMADKEALLDRITRQHDRDRIEPMGTDRYDEHPEGDLATVRAEAPASPMGGLWFTVDDDAPGGTRPLTEAELAEITARVEATHDRALAHDDELSSHYVDDTSVDEGWSR